MTTQIPVSKPLLDGNEKKYLLECIETGWISSEGPFVRKFEEQMAARVGRRHAIAVANGTAALQVAVEALQLEPGSEVILPAFTIISCALAIVRAGLKPVVVDADPRTWNMDVGQIESKITSRTKAIMVVQIYGLPTDMNPVIQLAKKHNLKIIEDCAEEIGQTCGGKPCGSFGDISIMSFYPNKHVTTGEGGMVFADDNQLGERSRWLRNLCFDADRRFIHEELGYNFRMTNLQAALGLAQLERLDDHIARKRAIGAEYQKRLKDVAGIELPVAKTGYAENIYWVFGILLKDSVKCDALDMIRRLGKEGIGSRSFFWPIHQQPCLKKLGLFASESCPVAERLAARGFYIPSGPDLSESQIETVVETLKRNLP